MKQDIQFIIVTYKPDAKVFNGLKEALKGAPFLIIENEKKNVGFGGGANKGIQKSLGNSFDWIVLLNQDLHLTKQTITDIKKRLAKSAPGIAGPFLGKLDSTRWTTELPSKKTDYISGSCMAIHRSVINNIGNFYEPYFMYYEDADLCVRAKKAGFPIIHLPIRGITHEDGTSFGAGSFLHQYYLARNHLLFVERNAPWIIKIHELLRMPKTIWEHWRRGETGALAGIRDYFFRRFGNSDRKL